jgi:hypothetical protein
MRINKADAALGYECRFAFHVNSKFSGDDAHFVKEIAHMPDGTKVPQIRVIKNFKRDFYVTKPGARQHKSKKEKESIEKLDRFVTTERDKLRSVAAALKQPWFKGKLKELSNSPYLYGSDITTSSVIKRRYAEKFPELNTPYSVAYFDTETDVLHNPKIKEVVMATITFKTKAVTAIQKSFVEKYPDAIEQIRRIADENIKETLETRKIDWEIVIVDKEIDVIKTTIAKAHEWKPDFLACWNMLYDIERVVDACKRANINPADILNDPSIPEEYRNFYLKIGPASRVTASGVHKSFKPAERWHTVYSPASFYWVCAMGSFRQIRTGGKEEPSHALDKILKKYAKISKLKFDVCSHLSGLPWHVEMQSKYPLHYAVYNLFDCVGGEILDEITLDLTVKLSMYSGYSDFDRFNSEPKRKIDHLHFFLKEKRKEVIAACGTDNSDGLDNMTVPLSGWITMLYPHKLAGRGLRCILENPWQDTNIHMGTSDLDVAAAYPNNQILANACKETTVTELVSIDGVPLELVKLNTINFSSGHVNALEFCVDILDMPTLFEMEDAFVAARNDEHYVKPTVVRQHYINTIEEDLEEYEQAA